jgi:hypothetical protein
VCAALEAAKIRCWIAPRDILPSAPWGASIVRAIDQCRVMVLIFSSHANKSRQVHREVNRAFSKGVTVVPLRIENVTPADELAYYLDTVHWLDALTPPLEKNLTLLVTTVRALLAAGDDRSATSDTGVDDAQAAEAQDQARAEDERRDREPSGQQRIAPAAQHDKDEAEAKQHTDEEVRQASAAQAAIHKAALAKGARELKFMGGFLVVCGFGFVCYEIWRAYTSLFPVEAYQVGLPLLPLVIANISLGLALVSKQIGVRKVAALVCAANAAVSALFVVSVAGELARSSDPSLPVIVILVSAAAIASLFIGYRLLSWRASQQAGSETAWRLHDTIGVVLLIAGVYGLWLIVTGIITGLQWGGLSFDPWVIAAPIHAALIFFGVLVTLGSRRLAPEWAMLAVCGIGVALYAAHIWHAFAEYEAESVGRYLVQFDVIGIVFNLGAIALLVYARSKAYQRSSY